MAELILCNQPTKTSQLDNLCGFTPATITGMSCSANPAILNSYTPYLTNSNPSVSDRSIMRWLGQPKVSKNVTDLTLSLGEDNTLALAEITQKLKGSGVELMGSSTAVYGKRLSGFAGSVKQYQSSLMEYRHVIQAKAGSAAQRMAKQRAALAFQKMQTGFKLELNAVTSGIKAGRKGTPFNDFNRASNIARSSRNVVKLDINSQLQASRLAQLGRHAKLLGNGLVILNVAERMGNIKTSYQAGQNWERELFIESGSFVASAVTGTVLANVGASALTFLMIATPVGWVGLIVGGLVVAGVAAGGAISMNNAIKSNSGEWYDSLMEWMQES